MRNNCSYFILAIACVFLAACSGDKKPPLKGDRISVLQYQDTLKADDEAQKAALEFPPAKANTAWPQQGGNASHTPQNLALNNGALSKIWSASIGEGSSKNRKLITPPVAANGRIFTADTTGKISAFDIAHGKRLWQVDVLPQDDAATVSSGLSYRLNVLYVTDGIGHVLALNAENGQKIWSQAVDQPVRGSPTVDGNRVYVVTLSDETIAMNTADGSILWRHEGVQESAGLLGAPSPAVDGSVVITAYSSGDVVALRAETGQEAWSDNLTGVSEFEGKAATQLAGFRGFPVLDQDVVIIGNAASRVISVHVPSGERIWQKEFGLMTTPWVSGNMVFAITAQNELVALVKETGQIRWTVALPRFENPQDREDAIFWNGPVLAGGRLLIVGSNGKLLEVDPNDGKTIRETGLSGNVMVSPIVVNNTFIVVTDKGEMVAYQ